MQNEINVYLEQQLYIKIEYAAVTDPKGAS